MADQDDLDILASLADSDFEFQDDDYLGEALSSSNASPKSTASVSSSKSQQHQKQGHGGDQVHVKSITTPHSSVEEMAGQLAACFSHNPLLVIVDIAYRCLSNLLKIWTPLSFSAGK